MAEYSWMTAVGAHWAKIEADYNAEWTSMAYLDGPGYTVMDRIEAKLDLQQKYFSRSSSHGVVNSTKEISTQASESHLTSPMDESNQQSNLRMVECAREIRESCARILKLLQEEIDTSESLDVDASQSYAEEMTETSLQEDIEVSETWNEDTIADATTIHRGLSMKFVVPFYLDIASLLIIQARSRQRIYSDAFFDDYKIVLVSVYGNLKVDITRIQQDSRFVPPDYLVVCCVNKNLGKDYFTPTTCLKKCLSEIGTIAMIEVITPKLGIKLNYIDNVTGMTKGKQDIEASLVASRFLSLTDGMHDLTSDFHIKNCIDWYNCVAIVSKNSLPRWGRDLVIKLGVFYIPARLPPLKPPDRSGCTALATAAPKLPIEFSFISCIWGIEDYCIIKVIDKVVMYEYSYTEALTLGFHLLSEYACSIILAINSILFELVLHNLEVIPLAISVHANLEEATPKPDKSTVTGVKLLCSQLSDGSSGQGNETKVVEGDIIMDDQLETTLIDFIAKCISFGKADDLFGDLQMRDWEAHFDFLYLVESYAVEPCFAKVTFALVNEMVKRGDDPKAVNCSLFMSSSNMSHTSWVHTIFAQMLVIRFSLKFLLVIFVPLAVVKMPSCTAISGILFFNQSCFYVVFTSAIMKLLSTTASSKLEISAMVEMSLFGFWVWGSQINLLGANIIVLPQNLKIWDPGGRYFSQKEDPINLMQLEIFLPSNQHCYLDNLEDKVAFKGDGIVMNSNTRNATWTKSQNEVRPQGEAQSNDTVRIIESLFMSGSIRTREGNRIRN